MDKMERLPTIDGKCDICTKPDGSRDHMNLQRCRECGVLVHELCYGMVPTTTKDVNFVCHACMAMGKEVEVNEPSKVGGITMKDILASREGVASFGEFIKCVRGGGSGGGGADASQSQSPAKRRQYQFNSEALATLENLIDFYMTAADFNDTSRNTREIYDTYLAKDATKRVELPSHVQCKIDDRMLSNENKLNIHEDEQIWQYDQGLMEDFFDEAKQEAIVSLEQHSRPFFTEYYKSSAFQSYLVKQRSTMQQMERPTECALCSVKTGVHAMHPLYDQFGKYGRQLVLPASGVGFMRKERRLAWVHTLCAMFICSNERTGGMVYGCMEDGEAEEESDAGDNDEEEESHMKGGNAKVIDSSSSEDEESNSLNSLEDMEQQMFIKCEKVFFPLMDCLQNAVTTSDEKEILACIDSLIQNVDTLTPPFLREYPIIKLVLSVKASYEEVNREIKARCKLLRKEMKRVYSAKEKNVPVGFKPVKRRQVGKAGYGADVDNKSHMNNGDGVSANIGGGHNDDGAGEDGTSPPGCETIVGINADEQQYSVGTAVVKQFGTVNRTGNITSYDTKNKTYRILFSQGDIKDVTEAEVSNLLLTSTAWFCIAAPTNGEENFYSQRVKAHRELVCSICKKKDNASRHCLRIPVQCNVGDQCEFDEFRKYHAKTKKSAKDGCTEAMHVGCARWGFDYAKVPKKRSLRLCYYFSGKPPTYSGEDEYKDPVSNCFCRFHAREIQEGMKKDREEGVRSDVAHDDEGSMSNASNEQNESDDSAERARQLYISISRKKNKKRIILEDSDEGSD